MKRVSLASCTMSLVFGFGFASQAYSASACLHPYDKVLPYDLPIGGDSANVLVHADVKLSYDCQTAAALATATADASVFNLDINLLSASANAVSNVNTGVTNGSIGLARVVVLGKEVVNEGLDLESLVDFDPSQDIDVSDTITFNVGPVPVPVNYGIEGTSGVHIKGGVQSIGVGLNVNPHTSSFAYVQAGVSGKIAKAYIRGDLVVLDDTMQNLLHYGVHDADVGPELRFSVNSSNTYLALQGGVDLIASFMGKNYQRALFDWPGVSSTKSLFDYSKPVAILQ